MNQKKKKMKKSVPIETEYPTIENVENVSSIRQWKQGSTPIRQWKQGSTLVAVDSMLAGIEEKRLSGNKSVKVRIFPRRNNTRCGTTT